MKQKKIVIAHRGACGYLPEHTLPAKAMAHAMNPDYIEQDIALSKDNVPMVIHDIYLETVSNVATLFPNKNRTDNHYYVIDFTLSELKKLNLSERFDAKTNNAVFKQRFPVHIGDFKIQTLQEELIFIKGLNKSTGKNIGIYPEIKQPAFHLKEGKDISKIVLKTLSDFGYKTKKDNCILQCFDAKELERIRTKLQCKLFLIQLTEHIKENEKLAYFASYADGIGPWYKQLINDEGEANIVKKAHALGLKVHAYTFRADDLGAFKNFNALLDFGFNTLNLDGLFTDFPDKAVKFLNAALD